MKKKTIILGLIMIIAIVLAGCADKKPDTPQETGTNGNNRPAASLSYIQAGSERVLTEGPTSMVIYPEEPTLIREIPAGTLLTVLAEAASEKQEWLLVRMRDISSPSNLIGWVKNEEVQAYDDSLKDRLVSPILVPAGTVVYPCSDDGDILLDKAETQYADAYGIVLRRADDKVLLSLTGGVELWAEAEDVQPGNP